MKIEHKTKLISVIQLILTDEEAQLIHTLLSNAPSRMGDLTDSMAAALGSALNDLGLLD